MQQCHLVQGNKQNAAEFGQSIDDDKEDYRITYNRYNFVLQ